MNVRALDPVEADLNQASRHFESERRGYGFRFVDEYNRIYESIQRFPQLYPLVEDGLQLHEVRNAVMERFDYRVIYLVRADEAVILAVSHTSRRPYHWHRRLADPAL